jgi:predicted phosphodiesterase
MERRSFLQLTAAASIVGTQQAADSPPAPMLRTGPPVAMAPRSDGVEIIWRVHDLARGFVEYGPTPELGMVQRDDGWGLRPAGDESIRVRLDGLKPGTTYHYRAITESMDRKHAIRSTSTVQTFSTLDPGAASTRFAVWNDTHQHIDTLRKLGELTPDADFLLWNGDICNDWHRAGEVADTILQPAGDLNLSTGHPLLLVRGNHDVRGPLASQLRDHAAMPEGQPWFAVRSGPVAALCLDTGEDKPDDHPNLFGRAASEPMRQAQAAWIRQVTARPGFRDAPYRLVFCHIPLRWSDETTDFGYDWYSKRSRGLWHDALVEWGAQIVISGHTHRDAHLDATHDFPYQQLVGGGPKMPQARLITGEADARQLVLTMIDMDGRETRRVSLAPCG